MQYEHVAEVINAASAAGPVEVWCSEETAETMREHGVFDEIPENIIVSSWVGKGLVLVACQT